MTCHHHVTSNFSKCSDFRSIWQILGISKSLEIQLKSLHKRLDILLCQTVMKRWLLSFYEQIYLENTNYLPYLNFNGIISIILKKISVISKVLMEWFV